MAIEISCVPVCVCVPMCVCVCLCVYVMIQCTSHYQGAWHTWSVHPNIENMKRADENLRSKTSSSAKGVIVPPPPHATPTSLMAPPSYATPTSLMASPTHATPTLFQDDLLLGQTELLCSHLKSLLLRPSTA